MNKRLPERIFVFGLTLAAAAGCSGFPISASPNQAPSQDSIGTIIVETAAAAQTQTAMFLPPPTETATMTPPFTELPTGTPTPTATATVIFRFSTKTLTPGPVLVGTGCELVAQDPANGTAIAPKQKFNTSWTIKNLGVDIWGKSEYDFRYVDGAKIQKQNVYDLPDNVDPGNEVTLTVSMKAPEKKGTYTTHWALLSGKKAVCEVSVNIIVK